MIWYSIYLRFKNQFALQMKLNSVKLLDNYKIDQLLIRCSYADGVMKTYYIETN